MYWYTTCVSVDVIFFPSPGVPPIRIGARSEQIDFSPFSIVVAGIKYNLPSCQFQPQSPTCNWWMSTYLIRCYKLFPNLIWRNNFILIAIFEVLHRVIISPKLDQIKAQKFDYPRLEVRTGYAWTRSRSDQKIVVKPGQDRLGAIVNLYIYTTYILYIYKP